MLFLICKYNLDMEKCSSIIDLYKFLFTDVIEYAEMQIY